MSQPKAPSAVSPAALGNQGLLGRTQYASTSGIGRGAVMAGAATPPGAGAATTPRSRFISGRYGSGSVTFSPSNGVTPVGDPKLRAETARLQAAQTQASKAPASAPAAPAAPAPVAPAAPALRLPPALRGNASAGWDHIMRRIGPPQVAPDGRIIHPSIYDQLRGTVEPPRTGFSRLLARLFDRRKSAAADAAAPARTTMQTSAPPAPKPPTPAGGGMPQRLGQAHSQAAANPPPSAPAATTRAFNTGIPHPRAPLRHFADANPRIGQSLYFDPSYNPSSQPRRVAGMPVEWFSPEKLPTGLNFLGSWLQSSVTPQWRPETGGTSPFGTGVGSSINPMFEYGARQADTALRRYQDFVPAGTQANEALDALRAFMADVQQQGGEQVAPLFAPEGAAQ